MQSTGRNNGRHMESWEAWCSEVGKRIVCGYGIRIGDNEDGSGFLTCPRCNHVCSWREGISEKTKTKGCAGCSGGLAPTGSSYRCRQCPSRFYWDAHEHDFVTGNNGTDWERLWNLMCEERQDPSEAEERRPSRPVWCQKCRNKDTAVMILRTKALPVLLKQLRG